MPNELLVFQERLADIQDKMEMLHKTADASQAGKLTDAQQRNWDALLAQREQVKDELERASELREQRRTAPAARSSGGMGGDASMQRLTELYDHADDDPSAGFQSGPEFLNAISRVASAGGVGAEMDPRLVRLAVDTESGLAFMLPAKFTPASVRRDFRAAAGSDEQGLYSDPYGGFAAQEILLPGMLQVGPEGDPTEPFTQKIPMTAPTAKILARTDKDHSTSVSGGFTVSRTPETVAATVSRTEMELIKLEVATLCGAFYMSWDLKESAPGAFPALLESGMRDQFSFTRLSEKVRGLGGDQYLGILTALASASLGPTITVARQAAGKIRGTDVTNMTMRLWRRSRGTLWLANHDCQPQLNRLGLEVFDSGATPISGASVLFRPSLIPGQPQMLDGIPLYYTELASALGTAGDLILADWSQFLEGVHTPLRRAESMHVRFLEREQTFLFWERTAGAPWWRTPLTPHKGANSLSPFVILGDAT